MDLDLRTRGVELDDPVRAVVERKLRFGLARFGRAIRSIFITVADQNGPKGGSDKLCRVRLVTHDGVPIVVEEVDSVTERAIDSAVDRAVRTIARQLARRRRKRGGQPKSSVRAALRIATTAG